MAAQYYLGGEFEKAAALYEKLHRKDPSSTYIYNNYLNSLMALKDYDGAEKMVKNQQKKFSSDLTFSVDRAWVLKQAGEIDKSKKLAKEVAQSVSSENQTVAVALAFVKRQFPEEAELSFLTGRKKANDPFIFAGDLASLYAMMGKKPEMVDEGILHTQANTQNIPAIQNLFQDNLQGSDWEYLIKKLRQTIQKDPNDAAINEMLMWALVQTKDFAAAFVQFRAHDKRNNLLGYKMMELANLALANGDFEHAIQCFVYVAELGEGNPYFFQAKFGLINVQYNRIAVYGRYKPEDLLSAEKAFQKFIQEFRGRFEIEPAERNLAHLYLFYLNKPDTAISILKDIAERPRVKKDFIGQVKLELGDAYLMMGDVWEAELIYSQVDKDFKEEAMGQEAKYRMARLFYYKGEFERANAYLDVLKTATTQLISNNAIDLSLLIQDNTGLDTTEEPMKLYADAELLIYRNQIEAGMKVLQQIESQYPFHALKDEILMAKAKAYIRSNQIDTAIYFLEQITTHFPTDILADNALFMLAQLNEYQKNNIPKAMEYYEQLLMKYPSSLFVVEARKRFRLLRGDKPDEKENNQIMFDRFTN